MEEIWKFKLEVKNRQKVLMPQEARILSLMVQNEQLCLWAQVTPDGPEVERYFRIFATGQPIEPVAGKRLQFVGSFHGSWYVGHVFEEVDF